jgi:hypothetical protein
MALETNLTTGPGQPIDKSTAELMMALYQARIKAFANQCPDLGIEISKEPRQLYFDLTNLNALLTALNAATKHVATCLGLTVLDSEGNPTLPTQSQLVLMQELVDLQAAGNYNEYKAKIKDINLAQTVLIAGCDDAGELIVDNTGVYSFYDMAGTNGVV